MKRRLFNLAAALSLVLCLRIVALWSRSYRHTDTFECTLLGSAANAWSQNGARHRAGVGARARACGEELARAARDNRGRICRAAPGELAGPALAESAQAL
jgi:hypothetical protein